MKLVINPIKYISAGEEVTIILESERNKALIRVRDRGIGIAKVEQKKIFDRFYRVNSDRSRQTVGSGFGLAIAIAIAQAHKGTIKVISELGTGSIFTVRLPILIPLFHRGLREIKVKAIVNRQLLFISC